MKDNFLTIILRVRNENLFLESFVKHYMAEGVDEIYILDDNSTEPFPQYALNHPKVFIFEANYFKSHHEKLLDAQLLYNHVVKHKTEWIMFIDADEFITTRKNPEKTIRQELETTFSDVDHVKIPWVQFGSNGRNKNPQNVLIDTTWRWNHDLKHPHPSNWEKGCCKYDKIEVKSIFRTSKFKELVTHCPKGAIGNVKIVDGVDKILPYEDEVQIWYHNLREENIERAYLTCNHYRTISKQQMKQKSDDSHLPLYRINNCYELQLQSDYSEVEDTLLKNKAIKRNYYENL